MESSREAETGAHVEDFEYVDTSTATKESIIDNVDNFNSIEELEDSSVNSDTPDPNVDPSPVPRVPELVDDPESLANDDADDRSPSDQDDKGTCQDRANQYHMDLRQEFPHVENLGTCMNRSYKVSKKNEPREHNTADCENED